MKLNHPLQDYAQVSVMTFDGGWCVKVWKQTGVSEIFDTYDDPNEARAARRELTREIRALRRILGRDVQWLPLDV